MRNRTQDLLDKTADFLVPRPRRIVRGVPIFDPCFGTHGYGRTVRKYISVLAVPGPVTTLLSVAFA